MVYFSFGTPTLDPNKIYVDSCSAYTQLMEEIYATKIHQAKNALYVECNTVVLVILKQLNCELWITGSTQKV